jgi:hypothetical protein
MATVASKRYRLYLKKEESKRRSATLLQNITATVLWLVRLITNIFNKSGMRKKRIIEKITVE